jgi:hypothetical protein
MGQPLLEMRRPNGGAEEKGYGMTSQVIIALGLPPSINRRVAKLGNASPEVKAWIKDSDARLLAARYKRRDIPRMSNLPRLLLRDNACLHLTEDRCEMRAAERQPTLSGRRGAHVAGARAFRLGRDDACNAAPPPPEVRNGSLASSRYGRGKNTPQHLTVFNRPSSCVTICGGQRKMRATNVMG